MESKVLEFYRRVVTTEFMGSVKGCGEVVTRAGIFESSVVIWLMIFQRLNSDHSLSAALEEIRIGGSRELLSETSGSIRARTGKISGATGGYAQGRRRVSLDMVMSVADRLNEAIVYSHRKQTYEGRKVYAVDGSTVRIEHSEENLQSYPATKNQYGEAHYPLVHIGIATDVVTGVALRPSFGPFDGPKVVSELELAEQLFGRLPAKSVVIGDRYYGCFRFTYQALQHGHDVIVRMKESNIKRFIGKPSTEYGECVVNWTPSAHERKKYDDFSTETTVQGRMLWFTIKEPGFKTLKLFLFTTLTLPLKKIVELYGLRWKVETDLRDIKSTMDMDAIHAKTPSMVAKELILGVTAYNLIRHVMAVAAQAATVDPRKLSFSRFLKRSRALANSPLTGRALEKALLLVLTDLKSLSIPQRKQRRFPEPRKKWPTGEQHFMTGSRNQQRQKLFNIISTT